LSMDSPSGPKNYSVIPPEELRCVWMSAGIVSYQLCDRQFDCDNCPLDAAMRKHCLAPAAAGPIMETAPGSTGPEKLRDNYRYSKNHCWLKAMDSENIRIGIEPRLSAALLVPKAVVLPSVGERLKKDQICLWIVMEDGTFPVRSPIDGDVTAINTISRDQPRELFLHPFDEGWLYEISGENAALDSASLLDTAKAEKVYAGDTLAFRETLLKTLKETSGAAGITLADGGILLHNISDMLGPKKYFAILREVFGR